jgi:hypothetical protein
VLTLSRKLDECKPLVPGPAERGGYGASQFKGVSWNKSRNKWEAQCKQTHLGRYTTEEAAARAYSDYLEDGIDPVRHREAPGRTSQFMDVCWNKNNNKWRTACKAGAYTRPLFS